MSGGSRVAKNLSSVRTKPAWSLPLLVTGCLLLLHAYPLPSVVRDAATGAWLPEYHLVFPRLHILFSPFCGVADLLTVFSLRQLILTGIYLMLAFWMFLRPRKALLVTLCFLVFLAWGSLVPRPMARLVASDPDVLLIDFHSHSRASHDGRPRFTAQRNMDWHAKQGFHAGFITDHNRIETSQQAKALSRLQWKSTGYRSLEGEEVSLWKTHLLTLGVHERIDNQPYDSDAAKVPLFVRDMRKKNIPVIASLPEYWFYHWGQGVQDFVSWGVGGFEIINSAPKALDFPLDKRKEIVSLAQQHNLVLTGITDNHGYGYATAVWNAMRMPGWQALDPDALEQRVLQDLQSKRFGAVQVLERVVYRSSSTMGLWVSPFINLFWYFRLLQLSQLLVWIGWIWVVPLLFNTKRYGTFR